jgi:hypothetical protein
MPILKTCNRCGDPVNFDGSVIHYHQVGEIALCGACSNSFNIWLANHKSDHGGDGYQHGHSHRPGDRRIKAARRKLVE